MNKYIATGNLVREPEIKYLGNGTALFKNAIAVKDDYKRDTTHFFNFVAFGKTAETMANYLQKGSKILIEASLNQSSYEKDGEKRTSIDLNVNRFEFLDSKKKESQNESNVSSYHNKENSYQDNSFLDSGESISIDDSDLPF